MIFDLASLGRQFNKLLDNGGFVVGNEVQLKLEVEVIKNKG